MMTIAGFRTEITAFLTSVFVLLNAFYPALLTDVQEKAILGVLITLGTVFLSIKIKRTAVK